MNTKEKLALALATLDDMHEWPAEGNINAESIDCDDVRVRAEGVLAQLRGAMTVVLLDPRGVEVERLVTTDATEAAKFAAEYIRLTLDDEAPLRGSINFFPGGEA